MRQCRTLVAFTGPLLLLTACKFDPSGLGTEGESAPDTGAGGSSSTSGTPIDPTTGGSTTTTTGIDPTTGPDDTTAADTTGAPCVGDCPPEIGWTVVGMVGEGVGHALVLDAAGDVIVAGDRTQQNDPMLANIWVAKFRGSDGVQVWERGRGGMASSNDFARGVALTDSGTIVVAGAIYEKEGQKADVWLGWIEPASGAVMSESDLGTAGWNGGGTDEWARAVAVHPNGDLLVAGDRCKSPCVTPDAWVGRYSPTGMSKWDQPMLPFGPGVVHSLAAKGEGLVFAGTDGFADAANPWRSRVRQLGESGGGQWSALPEDPDQSSYEARALALAADGQVWVVGRVFKNADELGGFARVYDPGTGAAPVIELELAGAAHAIAVADGVVMIGGGVEQRLWFARYSGSLEMAWTVEVDDGPYVARGLAIDADGDALVLGALASENRADGERLWLRKYVAAAAP